MPKITFQVPQIAGGRKFFVKLDKLEGLHDFRGPAEWRNKFTEDGFTHTLRVRLDHRGILELLAFPYTVHDDRTFVKVDFNAPLTVIFYSITYDEGELPNTSTVYFADDCKKD